MGKKHFSYIAEKYTQGASDLELFSFCANAGELYEWGGVPAKTERFHGGFQRALSNRHTKIKRFFDDGQASPTSIVVAFREGVLNTHPLGYPTVWQFASSLTHKPQFELVSFEFESYDENTPLQKLRDEVAKLIRPRLELSASQQETNEFLEESIEPEEELEDDESDTSIEDEPTGEQTEELDVGQSKLKYFYDFISNTGAVEEWLQSMTAKYNEAKSKNNKVKKDREVLEYTPEQRLKSILISLLRPATIVDGQHRVWGAYHSDQPNIIFSVCAMKDTSWIEQVFQFVVLNKLAKPISTTFLTGLLNTSLTNVEVKEIESRLENIGVKNVDRKIIKYLNHDERSPFEGMIAEAGEIAGSDNRGKLSDKGMIKLAKRWKTLGNQKLEIAMFRKSLEATSVAATKRAWQNYETWIPYFYEFWGRVKKKYDKDGIWVKEVKFHLLYIVTMHAMQDAFIIDQSEANKEFDSLEQFGEEVDKYFKDVPGTFFQAWETTGLQSGDGPRWIKEALSSLRKGMKLSRLRESSELFKRKEKQ